MAFNPPRITCVTTHMGNCQLGLLTQALVSSIIIGGSQVSMEGSVAEFSCLDSSP